MSFKEETLLKAMDVVQSFYSEWLYDPKVDIYRAKDIANALTSTQWESKEWATEMIVHHSKPGESMLVMGGWYGLLSGLLKENRRNPESVDLDPMCKVLGKRLFPRVQFHTDDAYEFFMARRNDFSFRS